ncbi:50S ribosomal protein L25/general stress protein Ctc [Streptomyces rapamycinicus]|uniref:Large ribosomal subunit protein bL25 n=2 Tax=Streptomyces rapamycinicus TaxID=1226757 RepID=A0A0A0NHD1_STRRN|nr:50S ribosomal protein L25/general stress protein Ctc [Streptomyces rapamycinicus]AGP55473.1 50S ribosomal protein L25 [Streptomyces rapamycinicus NRRL 5491]MBB4783033.1 large subunit ribosomal protein L25 [Streptomyces rapamycinicus]RLV81492.1 50S ribosomal protein L25 [Streptomyces rapamycinicus NRRL 5491]UTO63478.1 50S ribosomal protein L25/general stress protein Ctc [Streptomyces rapamycinicus]UTP31435.1 50S ribosomal protein L25/general stress protein Ctc [Streptomyces rapamycinicus NRR
MAEVKIGAKPRTEFGKGAARRTRAADRVPGVVYGHGVEPLHVTLPAHDLLMALKTPNVLIRLDVEGGKNELVIPKAVQRHPIKIGVLEHIDLLLVKKGEKVTVEVPILTEGDLAPGGNLLEHLLNALPVETEATHIPESVTVSIAGLDAGATIHAKDITLPAGTTLAVEEDAAVLQVVAAQAEAPAEEGAEGEAEGAEA